METESGDQNEDVLMRTQCDYTKFQGSPLPNLSSAGYSVKLNYKKKNN